MLCNCKGLATRLRLSRNCLSRSRAGLRAEREARREAEREAARVVEDRIVADPATIEKRAILAGAFADVFRKVMDAAGHRLRIVRRA